MKQRLSSICPIFVLLIGLTSCARNEKPGQDVFRAPPPKIVRSGAVFDLKAWDQESVKSVRLTDGLDVRESGAADVTVTARCRLRGQDYLFTSHIPTNTVAEILTLVPEEILAEPLSTESALCGFEIVMSNSLGSRHIFNIAEMPIQSEDEAKITGVILRNGQRLPPALTEFTFADLETVRVEADLPSPKSAQLICQDVFSAKLDFDASLRLGDLSSENIAENKRARSPALAERPRQFCRVIFLSAGIRRGMTPLFRLRFPEASLKVALVQAPFRTYERRSPSIVNQLLGQTPRTLTNEFLIQNESPHTRIIRIEKRRLTVHLGMPIYYLSDVPQPGLILPWLGVQPLPGPGADIKDKGDFWQVTLAVGASMNVTVLFELMDFFLCNRKMPDDKATDIVLDFPEPLVITEWSEAGENLGATAIPLGGRMMLVHRADEWNLQNYRFREVGVCEGARR